VRFVVELAEMISELRWEFSSFAIEAGGADGLS